MSDFQSPIIDNSIPKEEQEKNNEILPSKITYSAPKFYYPCCFLCFIFIFGFGLLIIFIQQYLKGKDKTFLYGLVFPIFLIILYIGFGLNYNYSFSITIDGNSEMIYVKITKMFCLICKSKKIPINNISYITYGTDYSSICVLNRVNYYWFYIDFVYFDGKKISFKTLIKNITEEKNKLFNILKSSLPNHIEINDIKKSYL